MKKKTMTLSKKLVLGKENITDLTRNQQGHIVGAAGTLGPNNCANTQYQGCVYDTCFCAPTTICPASSPEQRLSVCCYKEAKTEADGCI